MALRQIVSLSDIKTHIGLSTTDTSNDTKLNIIVRGVSDMICRYCGHDFHEHTYTDEWHENIPTVKLVLKHYPITSVTSVYEEDTLVDSTYYRLDLDSGIILYKDWVTKALFENTKVTYTAGYTDVPNGVKLICLEISADIYNKRNEIGNSSVAAIKIGDVSVRFRDEDFITDQTRRVLKLYKKLM